jgi:hypothetical protein
MHEHQVPFARQIQGVLVGAVVDIAVQNHLTAELDDRFHLDRRRGLRHHDHRRYGAVARCQCDALRVIAGRSTDHAARGDRCRQMGDLVIGPAQFEREHRLQVFALEQHAVAKPARQAWRRVEWGLDRDIVDARFEYALQVIVAHGQAKLKP